MAMANGVRRFVAINTTSAPRTTPVQRRRSISAKKSICKPDNAAATHSLLKEVGEWSQLTGFSGATECRLFTPEEYREAIQICMSAGTEIDIATEQNKFR